MRWKYSIALALLVVTGCSKGQPGPALDADRPSRELSAQELARMLHHDDRPLRLRTSRDRLPSGLSAAMLPMMIDWSRTESDLGDDRVVMHNVNYGGNPLEGTTALHNVEIPLDGIERVEWILVPLGPGGRSAAVHHGQLRFVFREDSPVRLLGFLDEETGGVATLRDLVFSWEAWRSPDAGYDMIKGMDPKSYDLSLRVYAGSQRYLEDFLGDRGWYCTPLKLPGGQEGLRELLSVVLALGDGVARETISDNIADLADGSREWAKLEAFASPHPISDDARLNLPPELRTYQSVLRSCASMAYYSVLVAAERLRERGVDEGLNAEHLDRPELGGDQAWMRQLAAQGVGGMFALGPKALNWLARNPQAIPKEIPGRLAAAGLVWRRDGNTVGYHYDGGDVTPYGPMSENLIR